MFRKLLKNKKAQNTAEYAILISLVVAGIIAMQTYAQRALQARVRDASKYLARETADLGSTAEYEPYYLSHDYNVMRFDESGQIYDNTQTRAYEDSSSVRERGGYKITTYNGSLEP